MPIRDLGPISMGIVEFARLAGVSVATVSRAFTGKGRISRQTSERIRKLAAKHGFTPNIHASRLSSKESRSIGLLLESRAADQGEAWCSAEFATEVARLLMHDAYSVNLMIADDARTRSFESAASARAVDGFVAAGTNAGFFELVRKLSRNLPCVLVGGSPDLAGPTLGCVTVAAREEIARFVRRLTGMGHRRIGFISGPSNEGLFIGFKKGLYQSQIPFMDSHRVEVAGRFDDGFKAIRRLVDRNPVSAVLCTSDLLAMGAIRGARELGLAVPNDLSIAGYGDMTCAAYFEPPLTTLEIPRGELARKALSLLKDMLADRKQGRRLSQAEAQQRYCLEVEPRLIQRSSVGVNKRSSAEFHSHD